MPAMMAALSWLLVMEATTARAQFLFSTNNGALTVEGYAGTDVSIIIPGTNDCMAVTSIDEGAFGATGLASVTVPGTVTNIGESAFVECLSLTNVVLTNGLVSIEQGAFIGCSALANITLPGSLNSLGDSAFLNCGLTCITVPGSVVSTGDSTFSGCQSLTNATICDGVTEIGGAVFKNCTALTRVSLPEGVTNLGSEAFYLCTNLASITIPGSVTNIGINAFYDCTNLATVYFRGNAPGVGNGAFASDDGNFGAIGYYLPGTTGWGPAIGGIPTQIWDAQAQRPNTGFSMRTNQFGFSIAASTNLTVVVEATTNLTGAAWQPLESIVLTNGAGYFSDSSWTNYYGGRFYRLSSP